MQMGLHKASMCNSGTHTAAMKEAVLKKLAIGQQYRLRSVNATPNDGGMVVKCRLTDISRNMAVFVHKNGMTESFTYPELWIQMMDGTLA